MSITKGGFKKFVGAATVAVVVGGCTDTGTNSNAGANDNQIGDDFDLCAQVYAYKSNKIMSESESQNYVFPENISEIPDAQDLVDNGLELLQWYYEHPTNPDAVSFTWLKGAASGNQDVGCPADISFENMTTYFPNYTPADEVKIYSTSSACINDPVYNPNLTINGLHSCFFCVSYTGAPSHYPVALVPTIRDESQVPNSQIIWENPQIFKNAIHCVQYHGAASLSNGEERCLPTPVYHNGELQVVPVWKTNPNIDPTLVNPNCHMNYALASTLLGSASELPLSDIMSIAVQSSLNCGATSSDFTTPDLRARALADSLIDKGIVSIKEDDNGEDPGNGNGNGNGDNGNGNGTSVLDIPRDVPKYNDWDC